MLITKTAQPLAFLLTSCRSLGIRTKKFSRVPCFSSNTLAQISKQVYPFLPSASKRTIYFLNQMRLSEKDTYSWYSLCPSWSLPPPLVPEPCFPEIFWCSVFKTLTYCSAITRFYSYLLFVFWKLKSLKITDGQHCINLICPQDEVLLF